VTKSELLVAAAFRGFAEALVAADGAASKKERAAQPAVVAKADVEAAVQATLPGILRDLVGDEAAIDPLAGAFGIGEIEDDRETRARAQGGDPGRFDPNMPGSSGWSTPPE
jgi:hypothetical protein